jgi:nitroreductase
VAAVSGSRRHPAVLAAPAVAQPGSVAPVEFQDVVRRRRMVRRYTTDPVPDASLDRLLRNALRGPSADFSQDRRCSCCGDDVARFWAVRNADGEPMPGDDGVRAAPVVVVPLSPKRLYLDRYAQPDKGWTDRDEARWPVPFWHIDTGFATLLILLTAVGEGLGALYFGIPPEWVEPFRREVGVPVDHEPIGAVTLGYDAETERRDLSGRCRPSEEVVHFGQW